MRQIFLQLLWGGSLSLLAAAGVFAADDTGYKGLKYFRYVNAEGLLVINAQLPPGQAQKGYQVITPSGYVIKDVAPALSEAEANRLAEERAAQERARQRDIELRRRYSSIEDIEVAKHRKLVQLQSNMTALEGNMNSLKAQIGEEQARAAGFERAGRQIPQNILDSLAALEEELKRTRELAESRQQQYDEISDKYDADRARFAELFPKDSDAERASSQ